MTRSTPAAAVVTLAAIGLVLSGCGGASHVIGPGARTTTSAPRSATSTTATAPHRASSPSSTPPSGTPTPVTPALTAQITSELSQLGQSLAQASGDLSTNGTGTTTGGK